MTKQKSVSTRSVISVTRPVQEIMEFFIRSNSGDNNAIERVNFGVKVPYQTASIKELGIRKLKVIRMDCYK